MSTNSEKSVVVSEEDIRACPEVPAGTVLTYFKLVGIGPNTMASAKYNGAEIHDIASRQPGFFILGQDVESLKEAMHDLVNRFLKAKESA